MYCPFFLKGVSEVVGLSNLAKIVDQGVSDKLSNSKTSKMEFVCPSLRLAEYVWVEL